MTRLVAAVLAAGLLFSSSARAEDLAGTDGARSVIEQQLEAFDAQDVERAFGFAAPSIKEMFGTPENFGAMVKRGYPMIWDPASTEFLEATRSESGIKQYLRVQARDGRSYIAEYLLVQIDGEWRIAGVRIEREEGAAAA